MELTVFLKMLSDISAIFLTGGFFAVLFTEATLMAVPALLISGAAAGCYLLRERGGLLRRLPLLIALGGFALAETAADRVILGVGILYLIYVTEKQMYLNDDGDFKDRFEHVMLLCFVLCLIMGLTMRGDILNGLLLPYVFMTVISGIALLRIIRHSRDVMDSGAFKLINLLSVALVCAVTLVFSSRAFIGSVASALYFVYDRVIVNVLMVFVYGMARFLSLFSRLFAMIFHREVRFYDNGDDGSIGSVEEILYDEVEGRVPPIVTWIVVGAIIAGAVFLAYKALKALAGKNRRFEKRDPFETGRQAIEEIKEPRRNIFARRDSRDTVRHRYRQFLRECIRRGLVITPDFDSKQIERGAEDLFFGAPLSGLRDIYIRARYSDREITPEDARRAGELYSSIKKASFTKKEENE